MMEAVSRGKDGMVTPPPPPADNGAAVSRALQAQKPQSSYLRFESRDLKSQPVAIRVSKFLFCPFRRRQCQNEGARLLRARAGRGPGEAGRGRARTGRGTGKERARTGSARV